MNGGWDNESAGGTFVEETSDAPPTVPPLLFLALALTALVISAVALAVGSFGANLLGYLLAAPAAFTLIVLFRRASLHRQLAEGVAPTELANRAAVAALVAGFALAAAHAYLIARHYG